MKHDDPNFLVKLERAISERWGEEAIENPKSHWTPEKEKKHSEEVKEFYKRKAFRDAKNSKEKYKGFLISNLLELRSAGEVQRLQKHLASQTKHIDWAEYYRRMSALRQKLPLLKKVFGEPTPDFCVTDLMDAEVLINQVSDFPIVPNEQRPADRTPEEYTPTRDEIKRLTYQG